VPSVTCPVIVDIDGVGVGVPVKVNVTVPRAPTLEHVPVTFAVPLPWAVIRPPALIVRTTVLLDCQPVHNDVTSCVVAFENVPVAVTCAVAPTRVRLPREADNATD
jgi:hypothetical protein